MDFPHYPLARIADGAPAVADTWNAITEQIEANMAALGEAIDGAGEAPYLVSDIQNLAYAGSVAPGRIGILVAAGQIDFYIFEEEGASEPPDVNNITGGYWRWLAGSPKRPIWSVTVGGHYGALKTSETALERLDLGADFATAAWMTGARAWLPALRTSIPVPVGSRLAQLVFRDGQYQVGIVLDPPINYEAGAQLTLYAQRLDSGRLLRISRNIDDVLVPLLNVDAVDDLGATVNFFSTARRVFLIGATFERIS
jgi:hypothetical protein